MVFHYFGVNIDLFYLRQQFGTSARGATLNTLMDIASSLNFKSRALSLDIDELSALKTPCILHWDLNHFVVLVAVQRNGIVIHDPALGRERSSLAAANRCVAECRYSEASLPQVIS